MSDGRGGGGGGNEKCYAAVDCCSRSRCFLCGGGGGVDCLVVGDGIGSMPYRGVQNTKTKTTVTFGPSRYQMRLKTVRRKRM